MCPETGLFVLLLAITAGHSADPTADPELTQRLRQTVPTNIVEISGASIESSKGFHLVDPYAQVSGEAVNKWATKPGGDQAVCAIRFAGEKRIEYELGNFDSAGQAADVGFQVTHHGRCGSCSTLEDLAVYLETPDLTTPARECARKWGMKGKKRCFQERIGFTEYCAESWAYNAANTRSECLGVCVGDYGFFNLVLGRYPGDNVDESGNLRPCLQCDEEKSGPGFKYSAGRTRRNSGIQSAIERPESELLPVDHTVYFRE